MKIVSQIHVSLFNTVVCLFLKRPFVKSAWSSSGDDVTKMNTSSSDDDQELFQKIGNGFKQVQMSLCYDFHIFISYIGSVVES